MPLSRILLLLPLTLLAIAQSPIPKCVQACITNNPNTNSFGCGADDLRCICGIIRSSYLADIAGCLESNCAGVDLEVFKSLATEFCTPTDWPSTSVSTDTIIVTNDLGSTASLISTGIISILPITSSLTRPSLPEPPHTDLTTTAIRVSTATSSLELTLSASRGQTSPATAPAGATSTDTISTTSIGDDSGGMGLRGEYVAFSAIISVIIGWLMVAGI